MQQVLSAVFLLIFSRQKKRNHDDMMLKVIIKFEKVLDESFKKTHH